MDETSTRLNITNGDAAGDLIREAGIEGDVLPWRDLMFEGPFAAGLDLAATSRARAAYYAATYATTGDPATGFRKRDRILQSSPRFDEVVLWFEHDLLDQLKLLQILDWFAGTERGATQLALICIGAYPGIAPFHGLGQLSPDQIAPLLQVRAPITDTQLDLARRGWAAFRSPDPTAIEDVLRDDLTALPFLSAALSRHLEEFPSLADGLARTDRQLLDLVAQGVEAPDALFAANMACETEMFIGDWSTYRRIGALCDPPTPLLRCVDDEPFRYPPGDAVSRAEFRKQRLSLTDAGRRVLAGTADAAAIRPFDFWLGGVHLRPGSLWRWDRAEKRLVREP